MKKGNSITLAFLLTIFFSVYFNPLAAEANNGEIEEGNIQEEVQGEKDFSEAEGSQDEKIFEENNDLHNDEEKTHSNNEAEKESIENKDQIEEDTKIEEQEDSNSETDEGSDKQPDSLDNEGEIESESTNEVFIKNTVLYEEGDSGPHIVELKKALVRLGFVKWSDPSPFYGSNTATVVKDFQRYYGLAQTGNADRTTRNKISQVLNPPYRDKDRGEPVVSLKEDLVELGFASWSNPSQFYGSNTEKVVKNFQKAYGLTADGVAGASTLAEIEKALKQQYRNGDSGQHIVELKKDLVRLGFAKWSNPSPFYGSNTASVVEDFQRYYGLAETGVADQMTRNKISQVLNPPYRNGDRGAQVVSLKEDLVELGFASWSNPSQFYGSNTARVVKEFQKAYGLTADGLAGTSTLAEIEKALKQQYRNGDSGQHIVELKKDLVRLGFAKWSNPSPFYGSNTASVVEDFQRYYGLAVTGVADQKTRNKINQVLNPPYRNGDRGAQVVRLKEDLVELGFASWSNPSQFYGSNTARVVKEFQKVYGLTADGIAGTVTLNKIEEVLANLYSIGDSGPHIVALKKDLTTLGFANWSNPTSNYGSNTASKVKDFQRAYGLNVTGKADALTRQTMKNNIIKVFLDPGHGGKDPGGTGYGLQEKNIVLDIALETGKVLENYYAGVEIKYSRTSDVFVELEERSRMANSWGADYFMSFHTNAWRGLGSGFESFIYNGSVAQETRNRQREIHSYIANRISVNDRGMKTENFNVLRNTEMPSILLEYMFIDNLSENNYLSKAYNRKHLAKITADAIANSYGLQKR
ncbi:peptidoglycan-binding protein [Oceanobacillus saliphilus]|uniref:peptidoglycan-binding protein n=1 Tax=Oceanobacillus saliphilus TaxID=2925834 RepID=UPI00201E10AA|nr:peptidoglycan-binding protein [Oceanobacillus saliphilus]